MATLPGEAVEGQTGHVADHNLLRNAIANHVHALRLEDLTNIAMSTVVDGTAIAYDASTGMWVGVPIVAWVNILADRARLDSIEARLDFLEGKVAAADVVDMVETIDAEIT